MAIKINTRSPFYTDARFDNNLTKGELNLYIYDGTKNTDKGTKKYNLVKANAINYVYSGFNIKGISFEISELVRDYLEVTFDGGYNQYNKWVTAQQLFYTGIEASGINTTVVTNQLVDSNANFTISLVGTNVINKETGDVATVTGFTSTTLTLSSDIFPSSGVLYTAGITVLTSDYIAYDGYGYFKDGRNPQNNQAYLQSNKKIYRLQDHNVRVPIDTDKAVSAVFRLNGQTVKSQTFTPSDESDEQVVYFNVGFSNADTYEQRVRLDGGTVEKTPLLEEYFGVENVGEVDEIYVSDGDKTEILKIITEPCSKYEPYKVVFVNKFGVLQDLFFSLKSTQSITTKSDMYKSSVFDYTGSATDLISGIGNKYDSNKHQYTQYHKLGRESITLNTDYLSEDYNDVMKQLMLSEQVWMMPTNSDEVYPVIPKTQSLTYKKSVNDKLIQYTVEFDMAFDEINNIR